MLYLGDCRASMRAMEAGSVQTCVTSPPYYGLRDYGHDDQIGMEETPEAFVANLVDVFREVRRVLRDDATVWLNLGDSYATTSKGSGGPSDKQESNAGSWYEPRKFNLTNGIKPKDLLGIPWRVAFALQADGWYLRQDIIWHKRNPMPESVTDRCTKAHEYIFLLSKSAKYFYDHEAVKEDAAYAGQMRGGSTNRYDTRNKRSVWTVTTKSFPGAHFATFPPKLIEPCIQAGTSERGCCPECGSAWTRVVEKPKPPEEVYTKSSKLQQWYSENPTKTIGWEPNCNCEGDGVGTVQDNRHGPTPCTVLDPFGGSGTTAMVAEKFGRKAIICELNQEYANMAIKRIESEQDAKGLFLGERLGI